MKNQLRSKRWESNFGLRPVNLKWQKLSTLDSSKTKKENNLEEICFLPFLLLSFSFVRMEPAGFLRYTQKLRAPAVAFTMALVVTAVTWNIRHNHRLDREAQIKAISVS